MFNPIDFINDNLSKTEQKYIIGAGHQACEIAYNIMQNLNISKKITKTREINNLKNLVFESLLKELSDTGLINFQYQDRTNKNKSYEYGILIGDKLKFTVSRVPGRYNIPRSAKYREALANEYLMANLFKSENSKNNEQRYGILTYSTFEDKLKFMSFGIPDRSCKNWLETPISIYNREDLSIIKTKESVEPEKILPNIKKTKIIKFIDERL